MRFGGWGRLGAAGTAGSKEAQRWAAGGSWEKAGPRIAVWRLGGGSPVTDGGELLSLWPASPTDGGCGPGLRTGMTSKLSGPRN